MKYLKIKNDGIIEPEALSLIGASTKVGDNSTIGQFGSGNKYALAYLLRNDYQVQVYSGKNIIPIGLVDANFREESFKLLEIAGRETSITTQMGKDWKLWQALRELYCNALDEGGASMELTDQVKPEAENTQFYINVDDEILSFVADFGSYFSENRKVLFECEYGKILEKQSNQSASIFRKGVKCYNTDKKSAYDYDFNSIAINESRIVEYSWHIAEKIWNMVKQCEDKNIVWSILRASGQNDFIESDMSDYTTSIYSNNMSDGFKDIIQQTNLAPKEYGGLLDEDDVHNHIFVPHKVFEKLQSLLDNDKVDRKFSITNNAIYKKVDWEPLWEQTLKEAFEFLEECDFHIPYQVEPVKFNRQNILASVKGEKILISGRCLEKGVNEVVNALIEEYIHIKYEVKDETRAMQTAIIDEFITYMKNKNAYSI